MLNISKPEYVYSKVDGEVIKLISTQDDDFYYVMDGHLPRLWELIDGQRARGQLLAAFAEDLGVTPEEIREEFDKILEELFSFGLVVETPTV